MAPRLLAALTLALCLAFAPPALANDDEPGADQPAGCQVASGDADADNVSPEDQCPAGDDEAGEPEGAEQCEPTPEPGTEPGDDGAGEEPAGDAGDDAADADDDDDGADGADDGADEADDESGSLGLPFESGREYRDFCDQPDFHAGFLHRRWRFGGEAGGFADGVLRLTLASMPRVPARFRDDAQRLAGLELAVLVGRRTKVARSSRAHASRRGRRGGSRRVTPRALRRAGRVQVEGKLLPPSRWRRDANGRRVPTVQAHRITISR